MFPKKFIRKSKFKIFLFVENSTKTVLSRSHHNFKILFDKIDFPFDAVGDFQTATACLTQYRWPNVKVIKLSILLYRDGGTGKAPRHVPYLKSEA